MGDDLGPIGMDATGIAVGAIVTWDRLDFVFRREDDPISITVAGKGVGGGDPPPPADPVTTAFGYVSG